MKFAITALLFSALAAAAPLNTTEPVVTVRVSTTQTFYTTVWANCTTTVTASLAPSLAASSISSVYPLWPASSSAPLVTSTSTAAPAPAAPVSSSVVPVSTSSLSSEVSTHDQDYHTSTVIITSVIPSTTVPSASSSSELTVTTTVMTNAASAATDTVYGGDGTWYETGLGACGWVNKDTDYIAAIGHGLFDQYTPGTNPNVNTLCGRKIRAYFQGKYVDVTAVDRCEGCKPYDLDFSPAAFTQLADQLVGRIKITWEWL